VREEPLRVGRIPFLVCAPFFHSSLPGLPGVRFVDGSPRELNASLASGSIDCAPSSSFEYARHPGRYLLLPGFCTSGRGEVKSVLFFSRSPWEAMDGKRVDLSPESETSNALFRVLSRFRYGVAPGMDSGAVSGSEPWGKVLIGDAALRESRIGRWPHRYDLAACWESWQDAPLPFGLWMIREEVWEARRPEVQRYHEHLGVSLSAFFADPGAALEAWNRVYPLPLPREEALDFFPTADYQLTPEHERGLLVFFGLCREAGLLSEVPALRFARD
jgi:chorismate dehydratase